VSKGTHTKPKRQRDSYYIIKQNPDSPVRAQTEQQIIIMAIIKMTSK